MNYYTSKYTLELAKAHSVCDFDFISFMKEEKLENKSIFHYGTHSVIEAKEYLNSKGVPVRI